MHSLNKSILYSFVSIALMVSILAPSVIKLEHALFEHFEEKCTNPGTVHLHKVELDCDFHKYQLSSQFYAPLFAHTFYAAISVKKKEGDNYSYISQYTKLHFTLRAPPTA